MSKRIRLTVDLGVDDVIDHLYRPEAKACWESFSDREKWECFDFIWDHQDDYEFEEGFYDGDLCDMVIEWRNQNPVKEESKHPRKLPRKYTANEAVDMNKPLWEGWSAMDYAKDNEMIMDMIMSGRSNTYRDDRIPKNKAELKKAIMDNCLPNVPKLQRAVVDYFAKRYGLK